MICSFTCMSDRVSLKHDGTDGTCNCFEEVVRIAIVHNGTAGQLIAALAVSGNTSRTTHNVKIV